MTRPRAPIVTVSCLILAVTGCQSVGSRRPTLPRRHSERSRGETAAPAVPPAPAPVDVPVAPAPVNPQPAGTAPETPKPLEATDSGPAKLRSLYQQAAERYAALPTYTAQLRRREQVNGQDKPEEVMLFKFRQEPWSVYFKWVGTQSTGREVIYVKGQHQGQIHTRLAQGDMPLMPAGKVIALAPDNPFVRSSSRHSITDAGIGMMIEHFGQLVAATERGDSRFGTLRYVGRTPRREFPQPLDEVEQTIRPGSEPPLPRGGKRHWFFDPESHLPLLVITHDASGHEVEFYCYERLQGPVALSDDDFNPEKLWKK